MACCGGLGLERKVALLEATPFYVYLDEDEMRLLANAFVRRRYACGQPVGDSPFYVTMAGEVEVRQGEQTLSRKRAGAFFSRRAGIVDDLSFVSRASSLTRRSVSMGRTIVGGRRSVGEILTSKDQARRISTAERKVAQRNSRALGNSGASADGAVPQQHAAKQIAKASSPLFARRRGGTRRRRSIRQLPVAGDPHSRARAASPRRLPIAGDTLSRPSAPTYRRDHHRGKCP